MDHRSVLLVGLLSGAALIGSTSSCSGPDPGQVTFIERPKGQTVDLSSGSSGVTVDGGSSGEGGSEAGVDGGTSGLPVTAFTGAPAYDPAGQANGGPSTNAGHNFPGNTPVTNPAGQNCMDCHKAGGSAANAIWGIAGTLYQTSAGTAVSTKAEVRLVDSTGKELSKVYVDGLGNFWSDTIVGGVPGGSKVGVRNGTATAQMKLMGLAIGSADNGCNSTKAGCHVPPQGKVYIAP